MSLVCKVADNGRLTVDQKVKVVLFYAVNRTILDSNQLSENEIVAADCSTGSFRKNIGKLNLVRSSKGDIGNE